MFHQREFTMFWSCLALLIVRSSHGSEIIGGKEVEPHSLPFMALLEGGKPKCGGTLIDRSWVLTAAHCKPIQGLWLGLHSKKANENNSRQGRMVVKSVPHPGYKTTEEGNDLMLLKLEIPVEVTDTVKVLKLIDTIKEPEAGTRCTVAGWGKTAFNDLRTSDVLMSVDVTVISRETCNSPEYYNSNPVITSSMICAGSDGKTTSDTCQGDSGGPLLCDGELVGVTSFGINCGLIKKPGVYSYLSQKQLNWIHETIEMMSDA